MQRMCDIYRISDRLQELRDKTISWAEQEAAREGEKRIWEKEQLYALQ